MSRKGPPFEAFLSVIKNTNSLSNVGSHVQNSDRLSLLLGFSCLFNSFRKKVAHFLVPGTAFCNLARRELVLVRVVNVNFKRRRRSMGLCPVINERFCLFHSRLVFFNHHWFGSRRRRRRDKGFRWSRWRGWRRDQGRSNNPIPRSSRNHKDISCKSTEQESKDGRKGQATRELGRKVPGTWVLVFYLFRSSPRPIEASLPVSESCFAFVERLAEGLRANEGSSRGYNPEISGR